MTSRVQKESRLNIRCNLKVRQVLEKAAAYSQVSVSEFILSHAVASAEQIVHEHEGKSLQPDDFRAFLDALDTPSQPTDALIRAFARHEKQVGP
jgi:uncharacterized protein (DUF1778 family)